MWIDYAIGFGGVALVAVVVGIIHTVMLNRDIAERRAQREADRAKTAQATK